MTMQDFDPIFRTGVQRARDHQALPRRRGHAKHFHFRDTFELRAREHVLLGLEKGWFVLALTCSHNRPLAALHLVLLLETSRVESEDTKVADG